MNALTHDETYRQSTALQFGAPLSSTTTMTALVYVALLTLGTVLVAAGTMTALGALSTSAGAFLAAGAVALGTTVALARSRRRAGV